MRFKTSHWDGRRKSYNWGCEKSFQLSFSWNGIISHMYWKPFLFN